MTIVKTTAHNQDIRNKNLLMVMMVMIFITIILERLIMIIN